MRLLLAAAVGTFFLAGPARPFAGQKPTSEPESVRKFVQSFYSWYKSLPWQQENADTAFRSKRSEFTKHLLRAFRRMERQEEATGYVILEMDPFLNVQDDEGCQYSAGKVTKKGATYWVDVNLTLPANDPYRGGPEFRNPFVIAKVVKVGGRYRFSDFYYPYDREGLLDMLE